MQKNQSSRSIGDIGENAVCDFLIRNGYEIVKRNFTVRGGEIDIIAMKNGVTAFVEVKTRQVGALEECEQAITAYKKRHIVKTAEVYISRLDEPCECRFDVAAVQIRDNKIVHLKYYVNAFDASIC